MRRTLGTLLAHLPGRRLAAAVVAALVSASCIVLVQNETFAVGTETNRANLVIYVDTTAVLEVVRVNAGTQKARDVVLARTPQHLHLPNKVMTLLCLVNTVLCAAGDRVPDIVLSWFRSDVRNRGDFGGNLADAARQGDCFAWTFVPQRNFTEKPIGNSGCRAR